MENLMSQLSKIIWQKLTKFYTKKPDKPIELLKWAQRLPKSAFIIWIAGQVSNEMIKYKPKNMKTEELLEHVDDASSFALQHSAERFIENHYFGYPSFEPQKDKLIGIFRKIVKKKITRYFSNNS
jgi:hypothetical protein